MTQPVLSTERLVVNFGGLTALSGLDLEVCRGQTVGLIGPNGAGKTTAFNAITGVIIPSDGRVVFMGRDVTGLNPPGIARSGIARTFQNIKLCGDLTVLENVMAAGHSVIRYSVLEAITGLGRFRSDERMLRGKAEQLLDTMGLLDAAREKAHSLPYGNQRKLEIARALALDPVLLLLDEPVAGMNPIETKEFADLLVAIKARFNLTVLLIDHDMGFVMGVCDKIKVLDYGVPIAFGTPEQIRADERVVAAYLGAGS